MIILSNCAKKSNTLPNSMDISKSLLKLKLAVVIKTSKDFKREVGN